jgi:DEAD/DEAH box helicase domain-containing protein
MNISTFIKQLRNSPDLRPQIKYHHYVPRHEPILLDEIPLSSEIRKILKAYKVEKLYSHQVKAIKTLQEGKDIVVSTPTASGKSFIYNLPIIEKIIRNKKTRGLYIFPLKALEQDQLRGFQNLTSIIHHQGVTAHIYDGDTSPADRKKIKKCLPNIIITNPDMLHRGILAYHRDWAEFFSDLSFVVIDEVHTYRGIFGSHLSQIIKRLKRICLVYNSTPQFILSSATIRNPADFCKKLTGKDIEVISDNGAPRSGQHFIFINPESSTTFLSAQIFIHCIKYGLRTIAFTKSRKVTELINMWVQQLEPGLKDAVSSYRAGFLSDERRFIEDKLSSGELKGVISTSALELGIDIGYLDACLLVGYPGTIINTWQRGGRVGRSGHESIIVLIADQDALDQYFIKHPENLFDQPFEAAVTDPENVNILRDHLTCAACESPITLKDTVFWGNDLRGHLEILEKAGKLSRTADNEARWFSTKKRPQMEVNIRSLGETYTIFDKATGEAVGTIDGIRAFRECHTGAIYLHRAKIYRVDKLHIAKKDIIVTSTRLKYFTRIRSEKETEIVEITDSKPEGQFIVRLGKLKVTEKITGYEKRRASGQELIGVFPLELPPQIFETVGLWVEIEPVIMKMIEDKGLHFMGGIHAIEHSAISLFPLFAICDRNDIGGISYTFHPEVEKSAIFIYDGYPGGIGLARRGFEVIFQLLTSTLELIKACPCENGCPACIYSPKCGSGNKPLDKHAAILILEVLTGALSLAHVAAIEEKTVKPDHSEFFHIKTQRRNRILYFDLETQKSSIDVGGWQNTHLMMMSVGVIYDDLEKKFYAFNKDEVNTLIEYLFTADLVIGFNHKKFDYAVLAPYTSRNLNSIPSFDILEDIYKRLGHRLSLDHLAKETMGKRKSADGLQALEWFKAGEIGKLTEYCRNDVIITRDLFLYGIENGYLVYKSKIHKERIRVLVDWDLDRIIENTTKGRG